MAERCFCIFEGGGAKGIAHIGALAAFERSSLQLVGFAGTSAGAIVAALAAAGYRSDELLGADHSLLDRLDRDKTNVWGFEAHKPIRTPPRLLGRAAWLGIYVSRLLLKYGIWLALVLLILSSGLIHWLGLNGELAEFVIQASLVFLLVLLPLYIIFPLASLKWVARAINQALALKIKGSRAPDWISFRDLADAGGHSLKIVASDISHRCLKVFSLEETPGEAVANAVAASVCLPGIFRPWRIGSSLHYDGGLLSNLPVWAFDAERAIDRDAWTAAISIADKPGAGARAPRSYGILASTISTALFGSDALNTRAVERLRMAPLAIGVGLLEFDMGREQALKVVDAAREACWSGVVLQIDVLPRLIESICERIVKDCRGLIQVARDSEGKPPLAGHIRAAMLFPIRGEPGVLLNEFGYGYADHADERIKIPIKGSLAGRALRENGPLYLDRTTPAEWERQFSRTEDRWFRKLSWRDAQWAVCIPYLHPPSEANLVLMLDGDQPLDIMDLGPTLESLVEKVDVILKTGLPTEKFEWL